VTDGGVEIARSQLLDLVEVSGGAVEFLQERSTAAGPEFVISLDTSGVERGPGGIEVRARERFEVVVSPGFPFEVPLAWSVHLRWAGTPHVQWGRHLCLYLAPSVEWNPTDGMRGFITRLSEWLQRAAAGTLDPDGQPLHPPAVYGKAEAGRVLIHPDVGDRVPWAADGSGRASTTLFAWCVVRKRRIDVLEWLDQSTAVDRVLDDNAPVFDHGKPYIVMPTVLIAGQFGSEYPQTVQSLSEGLSAHGYSRDQLLWDLASSTLINRQLRKRQKAQDKTAAGKLWDENDDDDVPLFTGMIVGTPSRRVDGVACQAHLAAWRLDSLSSRMADLFGSARSLSETDLPERVRELALGWFESAKVAWMSVMEMRPEVTNRRDADTPASWLAGKRVLVMGCGALGGPVAEFCVRAGSSELTVADSGVVGPGILVRQSFTDGDIGRSKAAALAERLSQIRPELDVVPVVGNVRTTLFGPHDDLTEFDLVIDATADASVRAVVERARKNLQVCPPLVAMVIGHEATRGLVTTSLTGASGGGADTFRKVALLASSHAAAWADMGDDLFPDEPRTELFFPEPGCSAPTFVGSAAQTAALAGLMLHEALLALERDADWVGSDPASPVSFASAVRLGSASDDLGTSRAEWPADLVAADPSAGFEVRISAVALAEVRAEARRGARVRGARIETGGMLLGAFDDATGIVYVDRVSGAPPDSYLSETYFQHGLDGVQERVDQELERTGRASGFVGFWHTHPGSRAHPSPTDEQGMASIVGPDGSRRRALMMILGGPAGSWGPWRDGDPGARPDVYVRVVPRSAGPVIDGHPGYVGGLDLQLLPQGSYFRGGFGGRVRVEPGAADLRPGISSTRASDRPSWWSRLRGSA
jgi:integrative and conjugative element protein (TIGR02256 family)